MEHESSMAILGEGLAMIMLSDVSPRYMTQSRTLRASAALRSTTSLTSGPHNCGGLIVVEADPSGFHKALACLSASLSSKTTQFSMLKGRVGSHRTRVGLEGMSYGGMTERPLCKSSKMSATSSSSIDSLLYWNLGIALAKDRKLFRRT